MAKKRKRKLRQKKLTARRAAGKSSGEAIRKAAGASRKRRGTKTTRARGTGRKGKLPARKITRKKKSTPEAPPLNVPPETRPKKSIVPENLRTEAPLRVRKAEEQKAPRHKRLRRSN